MTQQRAEERREYPRVRVKFNVVLIGEGLRPRGCRVLDVSQGGVLLEWPDSGIGNGVSGPGLAHFFQRGDLVEVRFSVESSLGGSRQNFHLAGYVVRVVERRIAVAFRQVEARLGLLLSRHMAIDSAAENLESQGQQRPSASASPTAPEAAASSPAGAAAEVRLAARGSGSNGAENGLATRGSLAKTSEEAVSNGGTQTMVNEGDRQRAAGSRATGSYLTAALFLLGLVAIVALTVASFSLQDRVEALEDELNNVVDLINSLESDRVDATNGLREIISDVSQRVESLAGHTHDLEARDAEPEATAQSSTQTGSIAAIEPPGAAKPSQSVAAVERPESAPTAGGDTGAAAAASASAALPAADRAGASETSESVAQGANEPASGAAAVPNPGGDWMLSLIALRNKAAADRLLAKGRALDIPVEQVEVSARGKPLWRLQVTGFESAQSAARYGEQIKGKLGLKEFWVSRR